MRTPNQSVVPFVDKVPDYEIRDGNMHITADEFCMCMSLRCFEQGMAKAARVIAVYRASGEIVPMRRKRGHAATS